MTRARIVAPHDPAWADALDGVVHDVHHTPAWASATAPLEGGEPAAVLVAGGSEADAVGLLVPFVRRPLDDGRWDAVSPYGYAGPAVAPGLDPAAARGSLAAAADALASAGCVTWFLRLHPLLDGWLAEHPACRPHGEVVSVVVGDDAAFEQGLRRGHRTDLRHARREGFATRVVTPGAVDVERFAALHADAMARLGAAAYHRFPPAHFAALASGLGNQLALVEVSVAGAVAAAGLFTLAESSGIAGYHLAAAVAAPPRGAAKLVIDAGRRLARERGLTRLLLGGGLGSAEDPLFAFKAGFSPERHRFRTLRLVLDEADHLERCQRVGSAPRTDGYFPAYRDPSPAAARPVEESP